MKPRTKALLVTYLAPAFASASSVAHAQQAVNPTPFVIPALREWKGGTGVFSLGRKAALVIDPAYAQELAAYVQTFSNDLRLLHPQSSFAIRKGKPDKGDIYFTLNTADTPLQPEGYSLTIGDSVTIQAKDAQGAFWATRSLLQMLEQAPSRTTIPRGSAQDYPQFPVRGFVLDVARKFFTIDFLRDYVKFMSYYKMNDFHIHLNDNGFRQFFNNDWNATYSAFRLENKTYPGLTATDGSYSKQEFIELQKLAESYGVTIVPEIDVPAHSLAFVKAVPQIGSEKYGKDHLDINNPLTYQVIDNVFKEYLEGPNPVFRGKEVHIGTDEYSKAEAEKFRAFTDHYIRYVQGFGKKVRIWGALTHAAGTTPVTVKDVTMNLWYNGYADPKEMFKQGYSGISTPDGTLYIVPKAGYYFDYLNVRSIYNNWTPNVIGNQTFAENHSQIKGGAFAVWNDHVGNGITQKDVHDRAFPAMQTLSHKMWLGTAANKTVSFDSFAKQSQQVGEGPGLNIRGKVASKDALVLHYNFEQSNIQDNSPNNWPATFNGGTNTALRGDKKALYLTGNSYLKTPLKGIGYGYTVSFFINLSEENKPDAVLFSSPDAVIKVKQQATGKLGFSRENYHYNFNYVVPLHQWTHIAITGDNKGTSLYANGLLVERLEGAMQEFPATKAKMAKVQTLFFPLQYIGSKDNGFRGYLDEIKVFNGILSADNIGNLANLRPIVAEPKETLIGTWKSGEVGETFVSKDWDITPQVSASGDVTMRFQYTEGEHRLDIAWAELLQNGTVMARDEHAGFTGGAAKDNTYRFELKTHMPGAKYTLRANVRADGGNDSNGDVFVTAR